MARQFENVNCQYGAPMGRRTFPNPGDLAPRTVRLFRVRLDAGGYDDGGAYWGAGPLYCATLTKAAEGKFNEYREFTRARSRFDAAALLDIEPALLAQPLKLPAHYSVTLEWCGQPEPRYVLRIFDKFASHHATREEAIAEALKHRREFLTSNSTTS